MTTLRPYHQQLVDTFKAHRVHVYGACGAEGFEVLQWLIKHGVTAVVAHDLTERDGLLAEWRRVHETASEDDLHAAENIFADESLEWKLGQAYAEAPGPDDIFFLPQSWFRYKVNDFLRPYFGQRNAVKPEFMDRVWSVTRLYFALFQGTLLAVTGSDGKTTTTRMLGAIMQHHAADRGVKCIETGNDRMHQQSLESVMAANAEDFLVLEISDRQLSFGFPLRPDVAVVTNVTPNKHMDDYGGFEQYVQVKGNLLRFQTPEQTAILNVDNPVCADILAEVGHGKRQWFSLETRPEHGAWVQDGHIQFCTHRGCEPLLHISDMKLRGDHNYANACAALLAAHAAGVPLETCTNALVEFAGVPHRLQPIRTWQRITFVEDSAGGNPANVPISVAAFRHEPLALIVGGYRPNLTHAEAEPIIEAFSAPHSVVALLLIGQVAPALKQLLETEASHCPHIEIVNDLPGAIHWVQQHAAELVAHGPATVCMTPAFESFDQYKDYRARAAHFVHLVSELPN